MPTTTETKKLHPQQLLLLLPLQLQRCSSRCSFSPASTSWTGAWLRGVLRGTREERREKVSDQMTTTMLECFFFFSSKRLFLVRMEAVPFVVVAFRASSRTQTYRVSPYEARKGAMNEGEARKETREMPLFALSQQRETRKKEKKMSFFFPSQPRLLVHFFYLFFHCARSYFHF
jgi:hypothetical protein